MTVAEGSLAATTPGTIGNNKGEMYGKEDHRRSKGKKAECLLGERGHV